MQVTSLSFFSYACRTEIDTCAQVAYSRSLKKWAHYNKSIALPRNIDHVPWYYILSVLDVGSMMNQFGRSLNYFYSI